MKLRLNSAKAEAQASSLSLAELGNIHSWMQYEVIFGITSVLWEEIILY